MKIGIHKNGALNLECIEYCKSNNIEFIELDAYSSDIIQQIIDGGVTHFFWHFHHILPSDILMARYLLFALRKINVKVYPDFDTCWYFDDKVAEKYILEAINAPIVDSWVFYDEERAFNWLRNYSEYPLVAKLRRGAGSYNVILLKNKNEAIKYARRMFRKGINPSPKLLADVKTKFIVAKRSGSIFSRLKKAPRFFRIMSNAKKGFPQEKGYTYFQKFIDGATCDYRLVVVGDKAWGSMRMVRENDFRASGAGQSFEDPNLIPLELARTAFNISDKLNSQSMSYDFVKDKDNKYHIVEISYCFGFDGGDGTFYWTRDLQLRHEKFTLIDELLSNFMK